MIEHNIEDIKYLSFKSLDDLGIVKNIFTTRFGGVSTGFHASMNLGFKNGDDAEKVAENYRRIARVLGAGQDHIVRSVQTHTTNVRYVSKKDCFRDGMLHEPAYTDVDGLITDIPGIALATFYADCVPLYFADPVNKAIGLSHSGWRGSVKRMGAATLEAMERHFGTRPEDVYAAIGPSICGSCYEVSRDVADEFAAVFPKHKDRILVPQDTPDKFRLDLWETNRIVLMEAGVPQEHIETAKLCTCCNSDWLFSHRASGGKRGNMAAFLMLI